MILGAAVLACACRRDAPEAPRGSTAAAEAEVRAASRGVADAEARKDALAVMPFWAEDAVVHFNGEAALKGKDAIRKMYAERLPRLDTFRAVQRLDSGRAGRGPRVGDGLDGRHAAERIGPAVDEQVPDRLEEGSRRQVADRRLRADRQPEDVAGTGARGATMRPVKSRLALLAIRRVRGARRRRGRTAARPGRGRPTSSGRDDPDARRREAPHEDLRAARGARARCRSCMQRTPYGIARGAQAARRAAQGLRRRRLRLRLPGPARQVRLGGRLRDAAAGPRARRHEDAGRGHRHLRHDRVASRERPGQQRPGRACSACPTRAGRRSWARSSRTRRSRRSRRRPRPRTCGSATTFHHNGAFRLSYGFEFAYWLESGKALEHFDFDRYDTYRLVPRPGPALQRQRPLLPREDPHVERLRRAPRLRRVLEEADADPAPARGPGPDAERRRLVGPGGLLRPSPDLRGPREARSEEPQPPRRRPVEPRRLDARRRRPARRDSLRQRDLEALPRGDPGALVRALPQGPRPAAAPRGPDLRGRREPLAALGGLAAGRADRGPQPLLRPGRLALLRAAGGRRR